MLKPIRCISDLFAAKRLFTKISTENKLMLSQMSFHQLSIESNNIMVLVALIYKRYKGISGTIISWLGCYIFVIS